MSAREDRPSVLDKGTLVPIGVAVACLVPISFGIIWVRDGQRDNVNAINATQAASETAIKELRTEMNNRFDNLAARSVNTVTWPEFESYMSRLARLNSALQVPEVRR